MTTTTDYNQQAIDFLAKTQTTLSAKYLKTGKHFTDDKDERDIYQIELKRGSRSYSFQFGQSIACSGEYNISIYVKNMLNVNRRFASAAEIKKLGLFSKTKTDVVRNVNYEIPTAYSVLACLQKYDCGTFEDFCSEFGYDTDSKKAEKTYNAVKGEFQSLCTLFTDAEIELLQEIN